MPVESGAPMPIGQCWQQNAVQQEIMIIQYNRFTVANFRKISFLYRYLQAHPIRYDISGKTISDLHIRYDNDISQYLLRTRGLSNPGICGFLPEQRMAQRMRIRHFYTSPLAHACSVQYQLIVKTHLLLGI